MLMDVLKSILIHFLFLRLKSITLFSRILIASLYLTGFVDFFISIFILIRIVLFEFCINSALLIYKEFYDFSKKNKR